MLRDWVGIVVGIALAVTVVWVVEPLDRWTGIPSAHHFLTILLLTAVFVQAYRRALRARDQFIQQRLGLFRQVSHQLRTPVTSIVAYVDILRDHPPEDAATRERFMNILAAEAQSLTGLVDDALALSRLESMLPWRDWRPVDLGQFVRETIDEMAPVAAGQGISLSVFLDPTTPPVVGQEDLLKQLLGNLVDNAIKYNRPNGRVRVGLRPDGGAVLLTVSDTGMGIEGEQQASIFQEFYRAHQPAGGRRRGTGLGLAVVRRIARLHGGSVEVQSQPGWGSIFTVRLPLQPETARLLGPGRLARWRWLAMGWAGSSGPANGVTESQPRAG